MSKKIQLTQNNVAIVDDEDFEIVSKYKWHFEHGYARSSPKFGTKVYMHLPPDPLHMFAVKDIDKANKIATEYQSSWLYKDKLLFLLGEKIMSAIQKAIDFLKEDGEISETPEQVELAENAQAELTQLLDIKNEAQARLVALGQTMPCGHLARYAVQGRDGTQFCIYCCAVAAEAENEILRGEQ